MNKMVACLLVSLLGFLGCSGSDAGTSVYSVQAVGLVDEDGLSVTAHVMDQEGNLSSDAMLTINDEPMNIGFFATEDMGMDTAENGVQCGDYQPSYFLNPLDVNEGDTVDFVAKGRQCFTLYSSSAVVPERITIIEPSGDEPLPAGEPVVVKWEGGAPCSQFRVRYYRGSDAEMFSSGMIQGSTEFITPAHWIDEGWGVIFVDGCYSVDEDDQKENESGVAIRVEADIYIEMVDGFKSEAVIQGGRVGASCAQRCVRLYNAFYANCKKQYSRPTAIATCEVRYSSYIAGCKRGCTFCYRDL